MSERSKRRAAELAVLDEAYRLIDSYGYLGHPYTELSKAVARHRDIGLDALRQPIVGNNTTDTSAEAGASVRKSVGLVAQECLDLIDVNGRTVDEIEVILHRSHQTVSARVNELRDKGWIIDSGRRRPTRSGRKAIVWVPSRMAR